MLQVLLEYKSVGEELLFEVVVLKAPMKAFEFLDGVVHFVVDYVVEEGVNFGEVPVEVQFLQNALGVLKELDLQQDLAKLQRNLF